MKSSRNNRNTDKKNSPAAGPKDGARNIPSTTGSGGPGEEPWPKPYAIDVKSVDGPDHLVEGVWHIYRATYKKPNGDVFPPWPLTWGLQNAPSGSKLAAPSGITNNEGVMTNAVFIPVSTSASVSVTVSADNTANDRGSSTVMYYPGTLLDSGDLIIRSADGNPLTLGAKHQLVIHSDTNPLPDGAQVFWTAYPDQLVFSGGGGQDGNMTTASGGIATIEITAAGVQDIPLAVVTAIAFAPEYSNRANPPFVAQFQASGLSLASVEGYPLSQQEWHVFRATYARSGQPIPDWPLTWSADPDITLATTSGHSGPDGVMTNAVRTTQLSDLQVATVWVAADNAPDWASVVHTFLPPPATRPGDGTITIAPLPGPLTVGKTYPLQATYRDSAGNLVPDDIWVGWEGYPSDRLTFSGGSNGGTGNIAKTKGGIATIQVTVSEGDEIPLAVITARSPRLDAGQWTGRYDHSEPDLVVNFQAGATQGDQITVTSDPDTPPLYAPTQLTATHTGTETVTQVDWAVDRKQDTTHWFKFEPERSQLTGDKGTTKLTVIGNPNADVTVDVYARPEPPDPKVTLEPKKLTFKAQDSVPPGTSLIVQSVEGDPLWGSYLHLVQAAYISNDGTIAKTDGWDGTITWKTVNGVVNWLTTDPTPTDDKGIATNALFGVGMDSTISAQATGTNEPAVRLTLSFADDISQPGQGSMKITTPPGPLTVGKAYPFSVTYRDGDNQLVPNNTPVTWYGFPKDRLTFSDGSNGGTGNIAYTDGNGVATINVTASAGSNNAKIAATGLLRPKTGAIDHSDTYGVNFQAGQPQTDEITVTSDDGDTPPLYAPYQLKATHTGTEPVTQVDWAVDRGKDTTHWFKFDPNLSQLTGDKGTTKLTVIGNPNADVTVDVYARPEPPDPKVTLEPKKLTFQHQPGGVPAGGATLIVESVEGDPLMPGIPHLVRAAYINNDGTRAGTDGGWDGTITWGSLNGSIVWLTKQGGSSSTDVTPTDDYGIATSAFYGVAADDTITAQATGTSDTDQVKLAFSINITQPGQGTMMLKPLNGMFTVGQPTPFSVTYTDKDGNAVADGTRVTWYGNPQDLLTFTDGSNGGTGNIAYTDGNGVATINVTASEAIPNLFATITATGLFNTQAGTTDHPPGAASVGFQAATAQPIVIQPPVGQLSLYTGYPLSATVPSGSGVKWLMWSAGPEEPQPDKPNQEHTFSFIPNPSPVDGFNTTTIKVVGPNKGVDKVTIYCRPLDPSNSTPIGQVDLAFNAVAVAPTSTLGLSAVDGNPIPSVAAVPGDITRLLLATYVDADGKPLPGKTITWTNPPGNSLAKGTTTTIHDGTTTNAIEEQIPGGPTGGRDTVSARVVEDNVKADDLWFGVWDKPLPQQITITPPAPPFTIGQEIPLTATYPGARNGTWILWEAFPADQIQLLDQRMTQIQDEKTSNNIVPQGETAFSGYVSASTFNPVTADRDHGDLKLSFTTAAPAVHGIKVEGPDSIPLYTPTQLTAVNQDPGDDKVTKVTWSPQEYADYTFIFNPTSPDMDPTYVKATTTLTVYGPNSDVTATVTAGAVEGAFPPPIPKSINFTSVPQELVPEGGVINVQSLDDPPLSVGDQHPITAKYTRKKDGHPYPGVSVTWSDAAGALTFVPNPSNTGPDGVATTYVKATASGSPTITATATNPDDNITKECGPLQLDFEDVPANPNAGTMTITPPSGDFTLGQPVVFNVQYLDAARAPMPPDKTQVYWYAFPSGAVAFDKNPTPVTGNQGNATNRVTGLGTTEIDNVAIYTSALNPETGAKDDGHAGPFNFKNVSVLTGIMINRPWAQNPDFSDVDPTTPCQVVTGKVSLAKAVGDGQISLATQPGALPVTFFTTGGNPIVADGNGRYPITTQNGSAEFLVGAKAPAIFTLQAYYPSTAATPLSSTDLILSTIGELWGGTGSPLVIENLDCTADPCVLNMPAPSLFPDPTFKVSIPQNAELKFDDSANVQIILNYRVAYSGTVAAIRQPNFASIAYAMLQPTGNTIGYIVGSGKSVQQYGDLTFDAKGTPQTYPVTGSGGAIFPAPVVVRNNPVSPNTVQATDIVNGLSGLIKPNSTPPGWLYQDGDKITLYYYLSGVYPLPAYDTCPVVPPKISSVYSVTYTVQQGDELTSDRAKTLDPLPQKFLAGYGKPGTIQLNFKVERGGQTYWSKASATMALDTATLDPS